MTPYTRAALMQRHENKELANLSIRKELVLIRPGFQVAKKGQSKERAEERKAGASSRTPNAVIYRNKYSTNYGVVKSDFGVGGNFMVGRKLLQNWICFHEVWDDAGFYVGCLRAV